MVKILCMPGQISFRINRAVSTVLMEFGPAHGCKRDYPNGARISRLDAAKIIKGIRAGVKRK